MAALRIGTTLAARYVVEAFIGAGGMGAVYRVRDVRSGGPYAVKVLRDARGELATRFLREARIAAALAHPNVARVEEVLELDDGAPAIVMELLSGESLGALLAREKRLAPPQIARIARGIVAAMRAAHERGVIHRDLKPDNVFLCANGVVKVLDFGIAKVTFDSSDPAVTATSLTETGQILGTPQYMAPEQIFGEKEIDGRADVWALGVILYEACSGALPFEGENAGQVFKAIALRPPMPLGERAPTAPAALVGLVAQMLVHARADRLGDLDEVERVLAALASHDVGVAATLPAHAAVIAAPAAPSKLSVSGSRSRRRWAAPLIVVMGLASVAAWKLASLPSATDAVSRSQAAASATPSSPVPVAPTAAVAAAAASAKETVTVGPSPSAAPPTSRRPSRSTLPKGPTASGSASSVPVLATSAPAPVSTPPANRSGALRRDEF